MGSEQTPGHENNRIRLLLNWLCVFLVFASISIVVALNLKGRLPDAKTPVPSATPSLKHSPPDARTTRLAGSGTKLVSLRSRFWTHLGIPLIDRLRDGPTGTDNTQTRFVSIEGNRAFSKELIATVLSQDTSLDTKSLITAWELLVYELYARHGYTRCQVQITQSASDSGTFEVNIHEGKQYLWGDVTLRTDFVSPEEVAQKLPLRVGRTVDLVAFKNAMQEIAACYRDQGYLDFAANYAMTADNKMATLEMIVAIHEGPRYKITKVDLAHVHRRVDVSALIGQPYMKQPVEYFLDVSGVSPEAIQIEKNRWLGEIHIKMRK